jgi:hypothetical protein
VSLTAPAITTQRVAQHTAGRVPWAPVSRVSEAPSTQERVIRAKLVPVIRRAVGEVEFDGHIERELRVDAQLEREVGLDLRERLEFDVDDGLTVGDRDLVERDRVSVLS